MGTESSSVLPFIRFGIIEGVKKMMASHTYNTRTLYLPLKFWLRFAGVVLPAGNTCLSDSSQLSNHDILNVRLFSPSEQRSVTDHSSTAWHVSLHNLCRQTEQARLII